MKKLFLSLAIIGYVMASQSCTDQEINSIIEQQNSVIDPNSMNGYVYPLSEAHQRMFPKSRSGSFETDWENCTQVTLNTGKYVNLPWANITDSNLPLQIRYDIKKEDGWNLIMHTFSTAADPTPGRNYMILYNQRTGMLKVLYYLETSWANNAGFWSISFNNYKFFNNAQELAIPMNVGNLINYYTVNNATTLSDISFCSGWNGFQVQLAYDINNDGCYLDIKTKNANVSNMELFAEFEGSSKGTLITHGSKNELSSLVTDIATVFGSEATNEINKRFKKEESSRSIIGGIGGAIVKYGANKILSSLTAGASKPTTTVTDLSFQTKIKGSIKGNIQFNSNSPVTSLSALFSQKQIGCQLGVWNLAESPTIYINPLADIIPDPNDVHSPYLEHWYRFRGITGYKYNLVINPDLNDHIIAQWVDIDIVRYFFGSDENPINQIPNFDYGNLVNQSGNIVYNEWEKDKLLYGKFMQKNSMYSDDMKVKVHSRHTSQTIDPQVVFLPKTQTYEEKYFDPNEHYLKFTLYLVTEFEGKRDTTMSSRTFTPRIEWDPVLYDQYKNVPMENLR